MSILGYTKIDFLIANPRSKVYHSWNCKSARKTIKNPLIINPNNREELKQLNGYRICGNCQPEPLSCGMDFFGDLSNNSHGKVLYSNEDEAIELVEEDL
ncbi:hypothetical protein MARBORIA2_14570 [Methanobrevibacter arboriphilus]|jgi:hypothetical protein|uniref:hypothetical protein n=1 Tax=Methanobrevibacter arboriphilus TaxID=39441 RepID=UPI0022EEAA18|nr:hypothetical protein [Methanobrevibacter arboriphilus]GLI12367.1 hypothetical protein MARBORIA2_14570 [Methanobrevibacter arboriphilus]